MHSRWNANARKTRKYMYYIYIYIYDASAWIPNGVFPMALKYKSLCMCFCYFLYTFNELFRNRFGLILPQWNKTCGLIYRRNPIRKNVWFLFCFFKTRVSWTYWRSLEAWPDATRRDALTFDEPFRNIFLLFYYNEIKHADQFADATLYEQMWDSYVYVQNVRFLIILT